MIILQNHLDLLAMNRRSELLADCRAVADELDRYSNATGNIIWMTPPRQAAAVHESANERLRGAIEHAEGIES